MPITLPPRPPDQQVLEKLRFIAEQDRWNHFRDDSNDPLSASAPLPVYSTAAEDLSEGRLLAAAELTAWHYLIFSNETIIGLAEAISLGTSELTYAGSYPANYAMALSMAIRRAEELSSSGDFELRTLIVPSLNFRAVWLQAAVDDLLLPVPPTPVKFEANAVLSDSAMISALRPLAEHRLRSTTNERPA